MSCRWSFDTSAIINGRRDLLPPHVFTSLWARVEDLIEAGEIRAVDVVRDELSRREDEAHTWAKSQRGLFLPLTEDIQEATRQVLNQHPKLMGAGQGRNAADPFVIGLAIAHGATVVTEETLTGNIAKPRIPDVCEALGVSWRPLVGFVADQGWTF